MNKQYAEYADYYRKHILEDVMPFWDNRCVDSLYGGYLTCFDRVGTLTDDHKYVWFQGRQLYIYALLYGQIEQRPQWLEAARSGCRFLLDHAYAGKGRWNYELTRDGTVITGTNSIFSDFHVIHGLAEYLKICDDPEAMAVLQESYDVLEHNMFDDTFKDIYENTWSPIFIWHDMYLTCLATADACADVLGFDRTDRLVTECLDKILHWFAKDEQKVIFEAVTRHGDVDLSTPKGRFINPGHTLESSWFCLDAAHRRGREKEVTRALEVVRWGNRIGEDRVFGGVVSYGDALGGTPTPIDWFKETNSLWNEKVWWPNAEALCCYAKAYSICGSSSFLEMFERQHRFCADFFYDRQYGEWYERLEPDGRVKVDSKGTPWKCAFHLVRSLVLVENTFRKLAQEAECSNQSAHAPAVNR